MWRIASSLVLILLLVSCAVQIRPEPVVKDLNARIWDLEATSWEHLHGKAVRAARDFGYRVSDQPAGLLIQSNEFFGSQIDKFCEYPIINAKTGGRMNTFASFQMEVTRSLSHTGRVQGVLVIEIPRGTRPLHARSYCRAFTELGFQPAASTGVYERELMEAIGAAERATTPRPATVAQEIEHPSPVAESEAPRQDQEGSTVGHPEVSSAGEQTTPESTKNEACDLEKELRKLGRLRDDGLLTDEEFTELKRKLLDRCG